MRYFGNFECLTRNGTPRRVYLDEFDALAAADEQRVRFGRDVVPYECGACRNWHLTPAERHTPNHACARCGKQAYHSEEGARRRAAIILKEKGTCLRVYACDYGEGWHLTSSL